MSQITEDDEFIITMFDYNTGKWYYLSTSSTLQKSLCDYKSGGDAYVLKYQTVNTNNNILTAYIRNGNNSVYTPSANDSQYYFPLFSLSQDVSVQNDDDDYWSFVKVSTIPLPAVSISNDINNGDIFFNTDYILSRGPNFTLYQNKLENYYGIIRLQPKNFDPSKWDGTPIPLPQMNVIDKKPGFGNASPPTSNSGKYFDTTPLVPFTCKVEENDSNDNGPNIWLILGILGIVGIIGIILVVVIFFIVRSENKKKKNKTKEDKDETKELKEQTKEKNIELNEDTDTS